MGRSLFLKSLSLCRLGSNLFAALYLTSRYLFVTEKSKSGI